MWIKNQVNGAEPFLNISVLTRLHYTKNEKLIAFQPYPLRKGKPLHCQTFKTLNHNFITGYIFTFSLSVCINSATFMTFPSLKKADEIPFLLVSCYPQLIIFMTMEILSVRQLKCSLTLYDYCASSVIFGLKIDEIFLRTDFFSARLNLLWTSGLFGENSGSERSVDTDTAVVFLRSRLVRGLLTCCAFWSTYELSLVKLAVGFCSSSEAKKSLLMQFVVCTSLSAWSSGFSQSEVMQSCGELSGVCSICKVFRSE